MKNLFNLWDLDLIMISKRPEIYTSQTGLEELIPVMVIVWLVVSSLLVLSSPSPSPSGCAAERSGRLGGDHRALFHPQPTGGIK